MQPGDVVSYFEMCRVEGTSLQRGMNFGRNGKLSVVLMSVRPGAPYADEIREDGRVLIYEGHDAIRIKGAVDPKEIDQPMRTPGGALTANGLFFNAATLYKDGVKNVELVKVYEKIRDGIWTYNGIFRLVDAWIQSAEKRNVFKFKLKLNIESRSSLESRGLDDIEHDRLIPASVKLVVWRRDRGCCVTCGAKDNLHFDHIIPYSKGGSSLTPDNIQLLCARHNLAKRDRIE